MGQLRQAFVHRSGLELSRLTSGNRDELLFDDVLTIAADGGRWRRTRAGPAGPAPALESHGKERNRS